MKKATSASVPDDEARPEYRFDYSKARPNRFVTRRGPRPVVVVLEPDVAKVRLVEDEWAAGSHRHLPHHDDFLRPGPLQTEVDDDRREDLRGRERDVSDRNVQAAAEPECD